jgi:Fe-S cluster assembly ATP-binding protein
MSSDERARAGLYVAWQSPITIPGVSVFSLCKVSYEAIGQTITTLTEFKHHLEALAVRVGLTKEHISRNVNEGFSGGERKRLELLQLLLLTPKLAVLDEIDSGLDARGIKIVAEIMRELVAQGTSFILITHSKRLLDEMVVDHTWEMKHGKISAGI